MRYLNTFIAITAVIHLFGCGPGSENNPEAAKTTSTSTAITQSPSTTTAVPAGRLYDFQETTVALASKTLLAQTYEQLPGTSSTLYDPNKYNYHWYVKNPQESAFFYKGSGIAFTYAYEKVGIYDVLLEVYDKTSGQQVRSRLIEMTVQAATLLSP